MANFDISFTHIVMFFLFSGVLTWTIILIAGIHAALGWIEPLFVRAAPVRRKPIIHRHAG